MSSEATPRRPPYDPAFLPAIQQFPSLSGDAALVVGAARERIKVLQDAAKEAILSDPDLEVTERAIPGPHGDITVAIITKKVPEGHAAPAARPGFVFMHGGAMCLGDRYFRVEADIIKEFDLVFISVEYRLSPEHPAPAQVQDSYAALLWVGDHLAELGIDPERLLVAGVSAGGGIAAGTALKARDEGGPKIRGLYLICPMLDDRNDNVSSKQFWSDGTYCGDSNRFWWGLALEGKAGSEDISEYVAPARAKDPSGLPPTYLDSGSTEPFRDEVIAFASKLWEFGVPAELHVWPGGPHGFTAWMPQADISKEASAASRNWIRRILK